MQTYFVQIVLGNSFRDLYVQATDDAGAVAAAKAQATAQERRWASFVL